MLWRWWNSEVKRQDKIRGVRRSHEAATGVLISLKGRLVLILAPTSRLAKIAKTAPDFCLRR